MKYLKRVLLVFFILVFLATTFAFGLLRYYRKEMAHLLIDTLKTDYAITLKVEDANVSFFSNWPYASVELKNVYVASDLYANKNEPILRAQSISLSLNLKKLIRKQFLINSVSIKDAQLLLIKNIDGSRNFEFKSNQKKFSPDVESNSISFEVNNVTIHNTQFNFINRSKKQNIDLHFVHEHIRLKHAQDGVKASLSGELFVGGLLLNVRKGAFLKNALVQTDLDFTVYFKSKMIVVHPVSSLMIERHRYDVNAFIELGETKKLMLRIESDATDYAKASKLLNLKIQRILNNFIIEKPFAIKALIIARLDAKEEPIAIVNFDVKDNTIKIGNSQIPYSHVYFKGTVLDLDSSRQLGNAETGKIFFHSIVGNIYDYPFAASLLINNLATPTVNIKAKLEVEASKIKYKVAKDFILKGNCLVDVSYDGPADKLNTKEFLGSDMHLNANLHFNNFSYQEKGKPYTYIVSGKANINNRDLQCNKLHLKLDGGEALLSGKVENFVNYVLGYGNSLKLILVAKSDYLNLNAYLQEKPPVSETHSEPKNLKTKTDTRKNIQNASEGNFDFDVKLFAKKLYLRRVEILNASVDLLYKKNLLTIKSIKANTCEGKISVKGSVFDLRKITLETDMEDINICNLFDEFENFGQNKVQSRHLKGNISAHAVFKADLDDNMEIKGESMVGEVKLRLKNGHLLNFEPVQNLSTFIFKNRDFDNVSFSELNERFKIRGYEMDIQELEIGSNILNLFVTGIYNFKDKSNLNVLIPWNNLKRRGKNYIPKTSGESAENARGLKLNFSGPTTNMKLSLGHKDIERK